MCDGWDELIFICVSCTDTLDTAYVSSDLLSVEIMVLCDLPLCCVLSDVIGAVESVRSVGLCDA